MPDNPRTITPDIEVGVVMCWLEKDMANLSLFDAYLAQRFPQRYRRVEAQGDSDGNELIDAEGGLVRQ